MLRFVKIMIGPRLVLFRTTMVSNGLSVPIPMRLSMIHGHLVSTIILFMRRRAMFAIRPCVTGQ